MQRGKLSGSFGVSRLSSRTSSLLRPSLSISPSTPYFATRNLAFSPEYCFPFRSRKPTCLTLRTQRTPIQHKHNSTSPNVESHSTTPQSISTPPPRPPPIGRYILAAGLTAFVTWQGASLYTTLTATPEDYVFETAEMRNLSFFLISLSQFSPLRLAPSAIRDTEIGKPEFIWGYFSFLKLNDNTYHFQIAPWVTETRMFISYDLIAPNPDRPNTFSGVMLGKVDVVAERKWGRVLLKSVEVVLPGNKRHPLPDRVSPTPVYGYTFSLFPFKSEYIPPQPQPTKPTRRNKQIKEKG